MHRRPLILILHQNMGSGHKRVARIVQGMLEARLDAEVTAVGAYEVLGSGFMTRFERAWNGVMQRNWVRFADFAGAFLTRATMMPLLEVRHTATFHKWLDSHSPDLIISTVDGLNKTLGLIKWGRLNGDSHRLY